MRWLVLSLVLLSPLSLHGESSYTLIAPLRTSLIDTSKQVRSYLQELAQNLNEKDSIISSLETRLTTLDQKLQEALLNLDSSEQSRIAAENSLIQAQKELTSLSTYWKDYQFWSDVRFYTACAFTVVTCILYITK